MALYEKFLNSKEANELFSFDDISREDLATLILEEKVSAPKVAELFEVSVSKVNYKKKKYDLVNKKKDIEEVTEALAVDTSEMTKKEIASAQVVSVDKVSIESGHTEVSKVCVEEAVLGLNEEEQLHIIKEIQAVLSKANSIAATSTKIGRNDICPCGSGIKYKKCCLAK